MSHLYVSCLKKHPDEGAKNPQKYEPLLQMYVTRFLAIWSALHAYDNLLTNPEHVYCIRVERSSAVMFEVDASAKTVFGLASRYLDWKIIEKGTGYASTRTSDD